MLIMAAVEIVAVELVYYLMNFEMIVMMIDEFVELVCVVMNVEAKVFDIDYLNYLNLKQQNQYVVNSRSFKKPKKKRQRTKD